MNTKLNMGVIEDKSITYSKLADDVAESITATMTGKADVNGTYPNMSVGLAEDLGGTEFNIDSQFSFRKTANGQHVKDGAARIEAIKGNSVVWNQLMNIPTKTIARAGLTLDFNGETGKITINGTADKDFEYSIAGTSFYANHYYYLRNDLKETSQVTYYITGQSTGNDVGGGSLYKFSAGTGLRYVIIRIKSGATFNNVVIRFSLTDLTQMFGAGNEPTTIEEFYQRIPQNIDINAYNEGEVIHMDVQSIESVGVNQWDEEWETGTLDETTGNKIYHNQIVRSKNYIPVIGGVQYYASYKGLVWCVYDENYNFIQSWDQPAYPLTLPQNARYALFRLSYNYGFVYNHDICVNLWDALINGKYFPYVKREQSLDIIGKYFPNGMKSAGTAHDEIRYNKASGKWEKVQRIGSVDMGTLSWEKSWYVEGDYRVYALIPDKAKELSNLLTSEYCQAGVHDGAMGESTITGSMYNNYVYIKDSSYAAQGADALIANLQGVILYYELAEPIVTEIDETINLDYPVWNVGTEKAVADTPSTPLKADIRYNFKANDWIRENKLAISDIREKLDKINEMETPTPDWNAQEGETGYIENRTHYSDTIRYGLPSNVENYEISFSNVGGRDAIFNFYFRGTFITEIIKRDDASEHLISASGANIKIKRKGDILFYITTNTNFSDTEYIESVSVVKQLSDYYIPDTIARKSEFTTINGQSITEGGNIDLVADGDEVSSLTLKPGCKIGSFSVDSDNNLSSHDVEHIVISNNSISISSDDYVDFTTIKDGRLQIVSEREDMPAMSIAGPNGIEIADPLRNQFDGYAIRAYDGMFGGLRPWVRVINDSSSSSDKTLTELDHTILIYTSSQQTIVLPNKPKDGQEYDILMSLTNSTSVKHVISSNSANIFVPKEGNLKSSLSVDAHGYIKLIYVKDSGFWWYYRMA